MQPNPETFLNNFEYNLLNKHVEYSDQHMGAGHSILSNKDVKIIKICTIIFIGIMTLALKVLAMFTLSMGILFLKSVILIYGWLPTQMILVTGSCIVLINIRKIIWVLQFLPTLPLLAEVSPRDVAIKRAKIKFKG